MIFDLLILNEKFPNKSMIKSKFSCFSIFIFINLPIEYSQFLLGFDEIVGETCSSSFYIKSSVNLILFFFIFTKFKRLIFYFLNHIYILIIIRYWKRHRNCTTVRKTCSKLGPKSTSTKWLDHRQKKDLLRKIKIKWII